MIAAGLEFPSTSRRAALTALLALPGNLAPTRVLENEGDSGDPISDPARFVATADERGASEKVSAPAAPHYTAAREIPDFDCANRANGAPEWGWKRRRAG